MKRLNEKHTKNTRLKIGLVVVSILLISTTLISVFIYSNYNGILVERDALTRQVNNLTNKIEEYETPKLKSSLDVADKEVYLQITGEVLNLGHETAYFCKLHVILYEGDVAAKDTYVHLGDNVGMIAAQHYDRVDAKVYYDGAHVTDWEITLEIGN